MWTGPVLLEDYQFLEKMGQFNREKIPERVVHARGMGAKGYFEVCSTSPVQSFVKELNSGKEPTSVTHSYFCALRVDQGIFIVGWKLISVWPHTSHQPCDYMLS
jgi:hypothetical protein